ncbi:transmembrane protein 145 [Elysia marginata]|uniref:Transmembrane protein 145 n=1 Tax=Elysia marginata TaxID=1093978 RepID=A0AAV4HTN7_9GAST|nr:transmembrane protein 145 [Elysia marginata]
MQYQLEYPHDFAVENLLFYYDDPGQWDSVYKRGLNCTQKVAALKGNNIFEIDRDIGCLSSRRDGRLWYTCNGTMNFGSSRERWWYVTVSRCGAPANTQVKGLYLYYKLHMTNGDDLLHKEFSADEFLKLRKRQLFHSTYKLYLVAVTLWTVHLFCMVVAWGSYGTTGWEMRRMEVLGRIIAAGSNIVFILMLILLAKGYTIVRGRLTNKAMVKITSFIFIYVVVSVALFIWEGIFFDPGLVLYYYESPPGYCMVAIILVGWLWFTKAAVFTLKHFKAKTNFYIAFYVIYSIWFWASPVIILIAMFAMAKWTREKTVNGVQQFVAYLGHVIFLILTMPNKVNANFPYHIKTTQIASVPEDGPLTGDDSARTDDEGGSRGRQTPGAYTLSSGAYYSGTGPNLEFFITTKADARQAGDGEGPMYGPLDLNNFRVQEESPPPVYSQAIADDQYRDATATTNLNDGGNHPEAKPEPQPQPVPDSEIPARVDHHHNINSNTTDTGFPAANSNNRLPPIRAGVHSGNEPSGRAGALPPISSNSRFGAIPTAPPAYEVDNGGGDLSSTPALYQPPTYADLFRVDKD